MNNQVKHKSRYPQISIQLLCDILAIIISYLIHYYLRFESGLFDASIKPNFQVFSFTGFVLIVYWLIIYFFSGMYKNWYGRSPFEEYYQLIKANFIGCMFILLLIFFDDSSLPRMLIIYYYIVLTICVLFFRTVAKRIEIKLRETGKISIPIILVGNLKESLEFMDIINKTPRWGYKPLGIITINSTKQEIENNSNVLGTTENFEKILNEYAPEVVILTKNISNQNSLMDILNYATEKNIKIKIEPDLYHIFTGQSKTNQLYSIPLIEVHTQLMKPWQIFLKRTFDIFFSLLVLIIGLPFWLLFALIIKIDSKGPVFYTQKRTGKDGRVFKIYKFRSMTYVPDFQQVRDFKQAWTSKNDLRVTKFGRFIRKTHLDEIPQFYNVLKGDMSVVGPRPEQPQMEEDFIEAFPYYKRRYLVRPGITGWWQVKYTEVILDLSEIENRLKDDFYYIENMSLQLDFEIIIRTVWCVLRGHGQS